MAGSRIRNAFSRTTILTVGKLLLYVVAGFAGGLVLGVASEEPELLAGHLRGETETIELEPALAYEPSGTAVPAGREGAGGGSGPDERWTVSDAAALPDAAALADPAALPDVAANRGAESDSPSLIERVSAWATGGAGSEAADDDVAGGERGGADPESASEPESRARARREAAGRSSIEGEWAIQVGAFGDSASANRLADQLERKGYAVAVLPASATSSRWRVRVQPIGEEGEARSVAKRIERDERLPTWVLRIEDAAGR